MRTTLWVAPVLLAASTAWAPARAAEKPDSAKLAEKRAAEALEPVSDDDAAEASDDTAPEVGEADDALGLEQESDPDDIETAEGSAIDVEKEADAYLQSTIAGTPAETAPAAPAPESAPGVAPRTEKVTVLVPTPKTPGDAPKAAEALPEALTVTPPTDIARLQQALNKNGAKLAVDGVLGQRTKVAVAEFQKKKGLPATGEANAETLNALKQ